LIIGADYGIVGSELLLRKKLFLKMENGIITRIYENTPKIYDEYYDESVIVPGFINAHTHIGDAVGREKAYGKSLKETVAPPNCLKYEILKNTPREILIEGMRTAIREMLSNGITTFVDFREGAVNGIYLLKQAIKGININAIILGRQNGSGVEEVLKIADGLGFSSLNHFSDEELANIKKMAKRMEKIIAYHASETPETRKKSIKKYKKSDILRGIELLDPDMIIHITYADMNDLKAVAKNNILAVLCPRSNGYFGYGPPPIKKIIELGIRFSIGTDNIMTNSPNIFREFDYLIRIARIQGIVIPPKKLLESVTSTPSRHLKINTGIIRTGYRADMFVFDLTKPNVAFIEDPIMAIVLRGTEKNIRKVYCNGVIFEEI